MHIGSAVGVKPAAIWNLVSGCSVRGALVDRSDIRRKRDFRVGDCCGQATGKG